MARKNVNEDVKSNKKAIKKEVEEYSADESSGSGSSVSFSPTPERKRTKASRSTRNRPKKRNLIRWNEVYDQRCLLALQHVLSIKGIKIPWDEVGAKLGETITEGAIVQHLAKLRSRLENDGIKVTPALQRGGRIRTSRTTVPNNVKTVSAKGAVAKRTGKSTAPNKNYSRTDDGKDVVKLEEFSPRKGEVKTIATADKAVDMTESVRGGIQTERHPSDDSKNPGRRMLYEDDDDGETIGSHDTTEYSSGSEDFHEQDAVAIGAPFLRLESSNKSSKVNSPARPMVIIPPRSLVVILLIGRTMAKCLAQSEENNCIEERRYLMGGDFRQDGSAAASGSLNLQSPWAPGQAIEGPINMYNGYEAEGSTALEKVNSGLAMSATPGSIIRESMVANAQPKFTDYGMQHGPFDHETGDTINPQFGFDYQYGDGTVTAMDDYRNSMADPFIYADSNTAGFSNTNVLPYPWESNHGFPISNERFTSRIMAPSNVSDYLKSSKAQSSHANHANVDFHSSSDFGHQDINGEAASLKVDHFMGSTDPFDHNLNSNGPGP